MHRNAALALLALVGLPLALAASGDLVTTGGLAGAGDNAPQLYCAGALASAHTPTHPLACDVTGPVSGVTTLRLRLMGASGHAYAYAGIGAQQLAYVDCTVSLALPPLTAMPADEPGARTCTSVFDLAGQSGAADLHFLADGPAGLVVEAQLERTDIPLP